MVSPKDICDDPNLDWPPLEEDGEVVTVSSPINIMPLKKIEVRASPATTLTLRDPIIQVAAAGRDTADILP